MWDGGVSVCHVGPQHRMFLGKTGGGRGQAQTSVSIYGAWSLHLGQNGGSRSPHWSHHITHMPHSTAVTREQFSTKRGSEEINILQNLLFLRKIEGENRLLDHKPNM